MRLYASSAGLDPTQLRAGEHLVMRVHEAHGDELPRGVAALDYLDIDERRALDAFAHSELLEWRERYDGALTIDGLCWPFIWETALYNEVFLPLIGQAVILKRALASTRPSELEWCDHDEQLDAVVAAVAHSCGFDLQTSPHARRSGGEAVGRPVSPVRAARRAAFELITGLGLPARLRPGAVLVSSYWPMMPLIDRMLADPRWRPAIVSDARPAGVSRSLRAARQGGWSGLPGRRRRARARERVLAAVQALGATTPQLEVEGVQLGRVVHDAALALARRHWGGELAVAGVMRSAMRRTSLHSVVVPYDHEPRSRLLIALAKEVDVPTVVFQHGTYVIPTELSDMTYVDFAAVWSLAVGPPIEFARPPWVIGYPMPHGDPPPTRARQGAASPRVLVLGHSWERGSMLLDPRDVMRHWLAAIESLRAAIPDAAITLRPHPADDLASVERLRERFGTLERDIETDLVELLGRTDICIGASTTGTLQAALVGTPAVLLNVCGRDWRWPLGGDTQVPVARTQAELEVWLQRWAAGEVLPGREDLLAGLGADGGDASGRFLSALASLSPAPAATSSGRRSIRPAAWS